MADLLKETDTLAQGYPKINAAIEQAEQALTTADNAMDTANSSIAVSNQALANSQSTQEQLNQVVIAGDSSVEAAQARVNADNTVTYATLKERLDTEYGEVTSQLAENVQQFAKIDNSIYTNESNTNIGYNAVGMGNGIDNIEVGFSNYGVWVNDSANPLKLIIREDGVCTIAGKIVATGATATGVVTQLKQPTFKTGDKINYQSTSFHLVKDPSTEEFSQYFTGVTKFVKAGSPYVMLNNRARLYKNPGLAYYIEVDADELADVIADSSLMFNAIFYVPYFDKRPVYQRILELTAYMDENICNFIYCPDIHLQAANTREDVGFGLVNYARSFYDMPVVANGDITDQQANVIIGAYEQTHLKSIRKVMNLLGNNCFVTKGNHDNNSLQSLGDTVSDSILKTMMFDKMRPNGWKITQVENKLYYFADNETLKIRFVFFDTHQNEYEVENTALGYINQDQLEWLANEALDLSSKGSEAPNWQTAFFGHIPLDFYAPTSCENGDEAWEIIKAFKDGLSVTIPAKTGTTTYHSLTGLTKDFSAQGAETVIGYFYGHIHKDDSFVQDGVNFITTAQFCSMGYNATSITTNVVKGIYTINEFTFDMVTIRKANRSINMYRIGNGADRTFIY